MNKLQILNFDNGTSRSIELLCTDAENIKRILRILGSDLEMEVLHDQVVEAFWDYRNKVDYWRLRSLSGFNSQILSYEVKSTLNRLTLNVLNLSKFFLDKHYHEDKGVCFAFKQTKDPKHKKEVFLKRQKIFEENVRYVIGCKLRNRSQHGELPVTKFSSGFKLRQSDDKRFVTFNVTFDYDELKKIDVPKTRIQKNNKFELTEILDGYVGAISEMHLDNRAITDDIMSSSRRELNEIIDKIASIENQTPGIIFLSKGKSGEEISLERFELANHLRMKHRSAIDYSEHAFDLNGY